MLVQSVPLALALILCDTLSEYDTDCDADPLFAADPLVCAQLPPLPSADPPLSEASTDIDPLCVTEAPADPVYLLQLLTVPATPVAVVVLLSP